MAVKQHTTECIYIHDGLAVSFPTSGCMNAIVDASDWESVKAHKWTYGGHGAERRATAAERAEGWPNKIKLHRWLLGLKGPRPLVDHANLNPMDNRRQNIRSSTFAQNDINRAAQKNSKTGLKGVSFHKKWRKFLAWISVDGKNRYLGGFQTPEEAAVAYDAAACELYGEYAYVNLPAQGEPCTANVK